MNDGVLASILNIRCECGVFSFDSIKFCNIFWFLGCNNVGGLVPPKDTSTHFWLNVFPVFWIFWRGSRVQYEMLCFTCYEFVVAVVPSVDIRSWQAGALVLYVG